MSLTLKRDVLPDMKRAFEPPGRDVGASCGQFLFDFYKKYTKPLSDFTTTKPI